MTYDWYKIFNLQDFMKTGLVSRTLNVFLSGHGQREITISRGHSVSLVIDGVLLPVDFMGENPYRREGFAVFKKENDDIFLGIEVPE